MIYDKQKCKYDKCAATKLQCMHVNETVYIVSNNEISMLFVLHVLLSMYFEYVLDTNEEK